MYRSIDFGGNIYIWDRTYDNIWSRDWIKRDKIQGLGTGAWDEADI